MGYIIMSQNRAFTLLELLVVVSVMGILSAIAIPNFIHSLGRAKVSRAISDMHSISIALEQYYLDHNAYPPDSSRPGVPVDNYPWILEGRVECILLTTPVAYLSSLPGDPFHHPTIQYGAGRKDAYAYAADRGLWGEGPVAVAMKKSGKNWALFSLGPDRDLDVDHFRLNPNDLNEDIIREIVNKTHWSIFDPSNGLSSSGDLPWLQGIGIPPLVYL